MLYTFLFYVAKRGSIIIYVTHYMAVIYAIYTKFIQFLGRYYITFFSIYLFLYYTTC